MNTTINTTANNANNNAKLLAMCNMLYNGKGFCVVQKPDYRGGHFHDIEPYNYECKPFEYVAWCGTPKKFVEEQPTFTIHIEPFHEEPKDYSYSAFEMVEWEISRR